jgi:hypothetical protein
MSLAASGALATLKCSAMDPVHTQKMFLVYFPMKIKGPETKGIVNVSCMITFGNATAQ